MSGEAIEAKNRGNDYFFKKDWENAKKEFTEAIKLDPSNHVYYSNRSACYSEQNLFEEALRDADECIRLNSDWARGYSRKGHALFKMSKFEEAAEAYRKGLDKDPSNLVLKEGLSLTEQRLARNSGREPMSMFANLQEKIASNHELSAYMSDPDFVKKISQIQSDPKTYFPMYLSDPKVMKIMGLLLQEMGVGNMSPMDENRESDWKEEANKKQEKPQSTLGDEQKPSEVEKEKGNVAYKNKKFDEAIEHYSKAFELDPDNIICLTNRAAVYMMQEHLEKARDDCNMAIELGRSKFASFKLIAKALSRLGDIAVKEEKLQEAVEHYKNSLIENNEYAVKKKLKQTEERIAEISRKNYISPEKAIEHKEKGNKFFSQGEWEKAINEYTKSIKRNPNDHLVYSNRAAAYSKLLAWEYALNDCEKCIQLDHTFAKAYLRKGKIENFLKQYQKAVMSFNAGLEYEPDSSQLLEAKQTTMMEVMRLSQEGKFDKEHQAKAMLDPTVQELINDQKIREVLEDLKTNSAAGVAALRDPEIMKKLEILMAAGVVHIG